MPQDALSRLPLIVAIGLDNLHGNIAVRAFALNSTNKNKRISPIQMANIISSVMEHYKSGVQIPKI